MKTCSACKQEKLLSEFHLRENSLDGRRAQCRSCYNERGASKKKREYVPGESRERQLKRKFNITSEEYDSMLVQQNGACAICGGQSLNGKMLSVDHDHRCCAGNFSCGQCIRGLLCNSCNLSMGLLRDNVETLISAAAYLMNFENVLENV